MGLGHAKIFSYKDEISLAMNLHFNFLRKNHTYTNLVGKVFDEDASQHGTHLG